MRIRVKDGTPSYREESLCRTCGHCIFVSGEAESQNLTLCNASYGTAISIRFKVTKCSKYYQAQTVTYSQLEDMAWTISVDKKTRELGFISPTERKLQEIERDEV